MMLHDGTVLPSFLNITSGMPASGAELSLNDPYLRIGRVVRAHFSGENTNASGGAAEYDVEVEYADINGAHTRQVYPRCQVASLFGGIADEIRYTPRTKTTNRADEDGDEGSMVLLLCINGNSRAGVILSGFPHPEAAKDIRADGHHLKFSFNGINLSINKDGELTVKYRGATNADGTLAESATPAAEGSTVTFSKDGSITLQTKDDKQHVKLDHTNSQLHISVAGGHVNIESDGTHLGGTAATEALVLGTTYRAKQTALNSSFVQCLQGITSSLNAVAQNIMLASSAATQPAAAPALAGASFHMSLVADQFRILRDAVNSFEDSSDEYLSLKNTSD